MADKFIVKVGDDTHEVDSGAIQVPDGFVLMSQDRFDTTIEDRVKREARAHKGKVSRGDLLADDDFFREASTSRGIELDDDMKPTGKLDQSKVRDLQAAWDAEHGKPLREANESLLGEVRKGRRLSLEQRLTRAAVKAGVKPSLLEPLFPGAVPPLIAQCADQYDWSDEDGAWFFKDVAQNPVFSENPIASGSKYATEDVFFEGLRKTDKEFRIFNDGRPGASNLDSPTPGPAAPGTVRRDDFQTGNMPVGTLEAIAKGEARVG